ncbi:hypothetical protein [Paraburkholderia kirstenboschensis]|uniref:DUF8168 domain-containing protein n=1 Tax=Paraburkholderia kirstenboschensis TaxID=1245436 RepID=A0ABZ0EDI3_9BURK|nr:hypothetical protein [Paraburkholderia kirstenboschensis]WOD14514.1 hypothetical protein RW095_03420 [Paraburkholderia kirstenboschensis]
MSEFTYYFTGRVIPERAGINLENVSFHVSAGDDVPAGVLYIQAFAGQLFGRLITPTAIKNVFTARNLVEDSARAVLGAVGFVFARGYAVEIVQFVAPDLVDDRVFGVDVPALEKLATDAGLTMGHLLNLMSTPSTWFFRRALGDFREALRNSTDTGFFVTAQSRR